MLARGGTSFVYVVEDGKAREVEVQIGQRQPGDVEVLAGLKKGQTIVVSGLQRIGNGAPVRVAARSG
jgi:membrane fusion protein, multidrug efflux system